MRPLSLLTAISLLIASPALAGEQALEKDYFGVIIPPARYMAAPPIKVMLKFLPKAALDTSCGKYAAASGAPPEACATITEGGCTVYFNEAEPIGADRFHSLFRHEIAHCSGWSADHPN